MTKHLKKAPSYRLSHCGTFPNYELDGSSLKNKSIIYLVSVGKDKFEGKWITRFINFIKEVEPENVFIVVADTLQRFNIEVDENLSEKEAFEASKLRGEIWIEKYKPYFSKLKQNYEFIRWEEIKDDSDYEKFFNEITQNESDDFKKLILESSKDYVSRSNRSLNLDRFVEQSTKFLKEECAVIRVLSKDINKIGIFYPGPPLSIFEYIIDRINNDFREKIDSFIKK